MFCFFTLRQALLQVGFVGVAFAAVLVIQRDIWNEEVARWLLTMCTLLAAGLVVRYLAKGLRHRSLHDPLTGLANRRLFVSQLNDALAERRADRLTAVLFLDLDRFKFVNDSFGHAYGDDLLRAVAGRLEGRVREGDLVARFGGDEFAVLCSEIDTYYDAVSLGDRLCEALEEPIQVGPDELHVSASIGLALAHGTGIDGDTLVRNADTAMYQAKELGGARCELFGEALRERIVTRLRTEHDLRRLLERGELDVAYQPIVSLTTGAVVGVEALARWNDPDRGLVPPEEFIPIAEQSGLIVPLGLQVLERACHQAMDWDALGGPLAGLPVSVNLSVRQFSHVDLVANVESALKRSRLRPERLVLEITESTLMEQTTEPLGLLRALRSRGVGLALDDFGSGYSSLSYVRDFPLDQLKLDRAFVAALHTNSPGAGDRRGDPQHGSGAGHPRHRRGHRDPGPAGRPDRPGLRARPGLPLRPPIPAGRAGGAAAGRRCLACQRRRRERDRIGHRLAARYPSPSPGDVAEWLRSGLQSRLHRFDSGRRLTG